MAKSKSGGYDFKGIKDKALTKPRDAAWDNWAKFEDVGDEVSGFIRDVFYRPAEGEFKEQRGITLEQEDGDLVNVAIKRIPFVLSKTNGLRLGDPLAVVFEKELAPRQKGYKGAKQFGFYGENLPENAGNETVAELEKADMKSYAENGGNDDGWDDPVVTPDEKKRPSTAARTGRSRKEEENEDEEDEDF